MEKVLEKKVLTEKTQIEQAKRLVTRAEFAVYWRRLNTDNYKKELQSLEKMQRYLTSESNQSHMEQSNMWKGMAEQISKHVTDYSNAIENSKVNAEKELAFLEEVKTKVYGDELYDFDYFTTIFKYADTNGDIAEFDKDLELALKAHGFIDKKEVKIEA